MTDAEVAEISVADIPVVILAGGRGARFDHESQLKPKPLIEVAGKPILQHIIDGFVAQGFKRFIVATGYLGDQIVDYFGGLDEYFCNGSRFGGTEFVHRNGSEVLTVDTGLDSHTGERVVQLAKHIGDKRFVLTYGDGLCDIDMRYLLQFHSSPYISAWEDHPAQLPLVTVTAVNPPGRFGVMQFNGTFRHYVRTFSEKGNNEWISGGFMVCEPEFITKYLMDDWGTYELESEALPAAADHWKMRGYRYEGYWKCMDSRRDLESIEEDVRQAGGRLPWRRDMMETEEQT